jgi:hypothetical protein
MANEVLYHPYAWTPRLKAIAQEVMHEIQAVAPELEVLFMGSAALGLPGLNDIDLDVLCPRKDLLRYSHKLETVLGKPHAQSEKLVAWKFERNSYDIDVILSDPAYSHVPRQRHHYELLKGNPDLLEDYRRLKLSWDCLPLDEYKKRKKSFYEKLDSL